LTSTISAAATDHLAAFRKESDTKLDLLNIKDQSLWTQVYSTWDKSQVVELEHFGFEAGVSGDLRIGYNLIL